MVISLGTIFVTGGVVLVEMSALVSMMRILNVSVLSISFSISSTLHTVSICSLSSFNNVSYSLNIVGLKIMAGQRTMSRLIGDLTGQTFVLPVMLTGQNSIY